MLTSQWSGQTSLEGLSLVCTSLQLAAHSQTPFAVFFLVSLIFLAFSLRELVLEGKWKPLEKARLLGISAPSGMNGQMPFL